MKSIKLLIILISILFLNNCAHEVNIQPVVAMDQVIDYDGVVTSQMKHAVSLSHYDTLDMTRGKTLFMMIIENCGEKPLYIDNDNISIIFEGGTGEWASKKINLQLSSDFARFIQEQINRKDIMFFETIEPLGESDFSENQLALYGSQLKMAIMKSELLQEQERQFRYAQPRFIMKPFIIMPDNSITTVLVSDTEEIKKDVEGNFIITVSIDGEDHNFTFARILL